MKNIEFQGTVVNKLAEITQLFPVDNRRLDGMPNPRTVGTVQVLTNLILTRIQRDYGDLTKLDGTVRIDFCLQGDPNRDDVGNGWQGIIKEKYPDVSASINTLRKALNLIESMGGAKWESNGRHRAGDLFCNVETLLLIEQACMKLLRPDMEQSEYVGDDQLSEEFWESHEVKKQQANPLRASLKWMGRVAKQVFKALPRLFELGFEVCKQAIAIWNEAHKIIVPPRKTLPACTIGFSWVDDKWLEMGDPCLE